MRVKKTIQNTLLRTHPLWSHFTPRFYYPYNFLGGKIYLNIKESRSMLARALKCYEPAKHQAIKNLLFNGETFIDVGGNKGDFSLLASRIVGENGKILSFEPEPENYKWIRKSIELNNYKNIKLYEIALSDSDGTSQLYLGEKSGWHSILPNKKNRKKGVIKIKTRTLDSIFEENNQTKVDMMKIDVEGAELKVLHGAYETIKDNKKIILLIDIHPHLGVNPKEICDFLSDLNLSIYKMRAPFNSTVKAGENLKEILAYR